MKEDEYNQLYNYITDNLGMYFDKICDATYLSNENYRFNFDGNIIVMIDPEIKMISLKYKKAYVGAVHSIAEFHSELSKLLNKSIHNATTVIENLNNKIANITTLKNSICH